MKYNLALPDEPNSHFEIRNDAGMNIGIAFQNEHPFDGCAPVTMKDAEDNARLWAASDDLLQALEEAKAHLDYIGWGDSYEREGTEKLAEFIESAIKKAKGL